jgi:phospholipid/cholesterol/gamma-HCH transport system substrate-binding protein
VAAVALAILLVGYLMFAGGGGGYTVKAQFLSGGQLTRGNLVEIGGVKVGTVKKLRITPNGRAEAEFSVNDAHAPLRTGTRAVIRAGSQSSVANRYIELHLPSERDAGADVEDGGSIGGIEQTTTGVELDQLFQTLDKRTRRSLRGLYAGSYNQWKGRGEDGNRGWRYLGTSLGASSRLFRELSYDRPVLERFLVNSSRFVGALASRREDLAQLVPNLSRTTGALAREKQALSEVIERLPPFMRQANTTYVNLRATLDDLEPFVDASKPVARKLRPVIHELRGFTHDGRPTINALADIIGRPGAANDLRDLQQTYPPLARIAVDKAQRNGKERDGAFDEMARAFTDSAPIVAHGRPYTPDFVSWFDDFSHTGGYDALGSFSRSQQYFNAFSFEQNIPVPIPQAERGEAFKKLAKINQFRRCPGASEEPADDGSNVWSADEQRELDCREADRPTGPKR